MSNYMSQPYEQNKPRTDENFPLLLKVLEVKQGKYDANKAKIDQTLALYKNQLKGLRDVDNEYISARIKEAEGVINGYGNRDYSLTTTTDTLLSSLKAVTDDPIVQSAVLNKARYDQYNLKVDEIRKKDPKLYNDTNYNYSLDRGGYEGYIKGEKKDLGNLNYVNYADYSKEFKDISENLDKYDTEIKKADNTRGDGYIYTRDGKVITPSKVKEIANSLLSQDAKKQMVVDGWGAYYQGATEKDKIENTKLAFTKFKDTALENEKANWLRYKAQADRTGSDEDKENERIANKNYLATEVKLTEMLDKATPEGLYGTMYSESLLNNFSNTFAYDNVAETVTPDSTFMKKVEMDYNRQRDAIKDSQWQADYQLKALKVNGGVGSGAVNTKADFGAVPADEVEKIAQTAHKDIEDLGASIDVVTEKMYQGLDTQTKEAVDQIVKDSKGDKTRGEVLSEYTESGKVSNTDADALHNLITDRYAKLAEYNKYAKEVQEESKGTLDSEGLVNRLVANPNIKIMWKTTDGKEKLFSAKTVLEATGVVDKQGKFQAKISSKPSLLNAIQKSIFADKVVSLGATEYQKTPYLESLALSLGEDINKIYTKTGQRGVSDRTGGAIINTFTLNPNSKTAKFLETHKKQGGYNKAGIFSADDSFDDIPEVNQYLRNTSPEEVDKKIGDKISKNLTTTFGKIVTIKPGTAEYVDLATQAGIDFNVKSLTPINIVKVPSDPNVVKVVTGKAGVTEGEGTYREATLRIADLPKNIVGQVDLYNTRPKLTLETFPDVKQKTKFTSMGGASLTGFANVYYGGKDNESVKRASLNTLEGATDFYFKEYSKDLGDKENPSELGKAVLNMLKSEDTYITVDKTNNADGIYIVPKIVKGNTTVFINTPTIEGGLITPENTDSTYKTMKKLPQTYINNYLSSVLTSKDKTQIDKLIKLYGK